MGCFSHEPPHNHCKLFPAALIPGACARCRGLCIRTPSSLSSEDDHPSTDLDFKHVIIFEIRSRAMRAKPNPKGPFLEEEEEEESLCWLLSPTTGELLIAPKAARDGEEDYDGTETFYSVKSCFSRCSSDGGSSYIKDFRGRSIWEEFRHCEGWPFGLCRRALMLPPLPTSPSDSWTWRKRNPVAKTT